LDAVDSIWVLQMPVLRGTDADAQATRILACVAAGGIAGKASDGPAVWDGARRLRIADSDRPTYIQCARAEQEANGALAPMPW
jgi:hypothetical protein